MSKKRVYKVAGTQTLETINKHIAILAQNDQTLAQWIRRVEAKQNEILAYLEQKSKVDAEWYAKNKRQDAKDRERDEEINTWMAQLKAVMEQAATTKKDE